MKYLTRFLVLIFLISLTSCENLMFIDAAQLYVVNFESNGGTEIEAYRTDRIEKAPACVKEDAEFLGWYTSSDFSSDKIIFPYELKENTTLYAKWLQKYQAFFETNGGSELIGYKASEIKNIPDSEKEENILLGWYTSAEFSGEPVTFPFTLTENTTFYAKWAHLYTAEFITNGGSTIENIYDISIKTEPETTKTGYTFSGWYLDSDFTKAVSFPYSITSDCKIYAKWEACSDITYTVKHFKQDENLVTYSLVETESLSGCTDDFTTAKPKSFIGFHNQTFKQERIASDGSTIVKISYDKDSFKIIFNKNAETEDTYSQVFFYDKEQTLDANEFIRKDFIFDGWATEKNGKVQFEDCASVKFTLNNKEEKNLYAVWSYGCVVNDETVSTMDLSNFSGAFIIKVIGEINQNTLLKLAQKIEESNENVILDLSKATGLDTICGTKDNTSVFSNCKKLTSVVLPKDLVTIGTYAFAYCDSLKSVTIPKNVKTICKYAFYNTGLEELNLNGTTTIEMFAFANCSSLNKIDMTGIKTISSNAFSACASLVDILIDAQTIDYRAFESCENLSSVTLSKSVSKIDCYAFQKCNNLNFVIFLDTNNWYNTAFSSSLVDVKDSAKNARNILCCLGSWYKK